MSPIRLLIIAFLVYACFLLIRSGKKNKKKVKTERPSKKVDGLASDILVEDPICNSLVPKQQAIKLQHENDVVYFCSEECCQKFKDENL